MTAVCQLNTTPAEVTSKLKRIVQRKEIECGKLSLEISAYSLDLEKMSDTIQQLNTFIYLFSTFQHEDPGYGAVNEVAKHLGSASELRTTNLDLKKTLLLEKKRQFEYVAAKKALEEKAQLECDEMVGEQTEHIEDAKRDMEASVDRLEEEARDLREKNLLLERALVGRTDCQAYVRVLEEIDQLKKARKACFQLREKQFEL